MKESELRIGNIVNADGNKSRIAEIMSNNRTYFQSDFYAVTIIDIVTKKEKQGLMSHLKPVVLNDKILKALGFHFELIENKYPYYTKELLAINISIHAESFDSFILQGGDDINIVLIRYLHQLQNLIYALTGSELHVSEL